MGNVDDSVIHLIHTIWNGALTVLIGVIGWFMRWNWNRVIDELDDKADKDALDAVKTDIDRRHSETLQVLREIRDSIAKNDGEATQMRNSLQQSMQALVGQVGEIKGWMSGQMMKT